MPNAIAAQRACVEEGNREGGADEAILPWLKICTEIWAFIMGKPALALIFRDQSEVDFFRGRGKEEF